MTDINLNALERDVEAARARFASDLARVRSPDTLARFKDDLLEEARATKDEWVDKGKDAVQDGAERAWTEIKERAAANPVAALAIGAGLAWRLYHRPPVATLLVGLGLMGLLRTSPAEHASSPYMGLQDDDPKPYRKATGEAGVGAIADAAKQTVQDLSAQAGDMARQAATEIADKAAVVRDRASEVLSDASDAARSTVTQVAGKAASLAEQAGHRIQEAMPDRENRDTYLLGAAAVAVAAAMGIAYQRRAREG